MSKVACLGSNDMKVFSKRLLKGIEICLLDYKWKSNIIITVDLQINEFERIL
jgi:hypothetical protein